MTGVQRRVFACPFCHQILLRVATGASWSRASLVLGQWVVLGRDTEPKGRRYSRQDNVPLGTNLPAVAASAARGASVPISTATAATPATEAAATALGFGTGFIHVDGATAELRSV